MLSITKLLICIKNIKIILNKGQIWQRMLLRINLSNLQKPQSNNQIKSFYKLCSLLLIPESTNEDYYPQKFNPNQL
jgi:hypothetical protein